MISQEQLDAKVQGIKKILDFTKDLGELLDDQVFVLTAWEFWKDGRDWENGIPELAEGRDPILKTRELCVQALKNIFGY
jgi:hypothetical protein